MAERGALREWREVCFVSLGTGAFPLGYSPVMVGEAGIEPTCLLVTPGRLRNAKSKVKPLVAAAEEFYASGWKWPHCGRAIFLMLVTSIRLRMGKKNTTRVVRSIGLQRRIRTGYILFLRQMLYRMS